MKLFINKNQMNIKNYLITKKKDLIKLKMKMIEIELSLKIKNVKKLLKNLKIFNQKKRNL